MITHQFIPVHQTMTVPSLNTVIIQANSRMKYVILITWLYYYSKTYYPMWTHTWTHISFSMNTVSLYHWSVLLKTFEKGTSLSKCSRYWGVKTLSHHFNKDFSIKVLNGLSVMGMKEGWRKASPEDQKPLVLTGARRALFWRTGEAHRKVNLHQPRADLLFWIITHIMH